MPAKKYSKRQQNLLIRHKKGMPFRHPLDNYKYIPPNETLSGYMGEY
jgi:hypothetical protein